MYFVLHDETLGDQVYLDLRGLSKDVWKKKLPDLRQEITDYLGIDPMMEPVPVEPGIHYFMGGIDVDAAHRTNLAHLYAAGECCSLYHGANRLGGNSMLGAIYGGMAAAESAYEDCRDDLDCPDCLECDATDSALSEPASTTLILEISDILYGALGIVRNETDLEQALGRLERLAAENSGSIRTLRRIEFAKMMVISALARKESRGAHFRSDYPKRDDRYKKYIRCDINGVIDEL
jgi:succinate dehydrogenase / fumarate reductase flavoprotein subunit